jgi:hypothetical protein
MMTAVEANVRTAEAAKHGLSRAFATAFEHRFFLPYDEFQTAWTQRVR